MKLKLKLIFGYTLLFVMNGDQQNCIKKAGGVRNESIFKDHYFPKFVGVKFRHRMVFVYRDFSHRCSSEVK